MISAGQTEDDRMVAVDAQSQDDRKDIPVIPEEDEASPKSGHLLNEETEDLTKVQREVPMTQPETDQEDNPDLEEETAID